MEYITRRRKCSSLRMDSDLTAPKSLVQEYTMRLAQPGETHRKNTYDAREIDIDKDLVSMSMSDLLKQLVLLDNRRRAR
jgi:hypothetical protein